MATRMPERNPSDVESVEAWPLTSLVLTQLAVTAVWGPYLIGVLILMAVSALLLALGAPYERVLDGRVALAVGVGLGAVITVQVMPRVWPAARQIRPARRVLACVAGPASTMLLAMGARYLGMIPAKGSMDPTEAVTILACTFGGAAASWPFLQRQSQA